MPFYSCVLSYVADECKQAGSDFALMKTALLYSFKCQLVSMTTS